MGRVMGRRLHWSWAWVRGRRRRRRVRGRKGTRDKGGSILGWVK